MTVMNGLKKTGLVLAVILFGPLFVLSIVSFAFNRTLGNPEYTKQTINQAGFYSAVGVTITTQAVGESGGEPVITAALQSAVSGDKIRTALEPLIDGMYSWLRGDTAQPAFTLAIGPIKSNFEQSLTAALQARAAGLPACSYATPPNGGDIYSINCIPPGTDINATIADAVSRVTNTASVFSNEVVADGTVSSQEAASLGVNDPTQNLPTALPKLFQFLTKGQWFFVAGTLLTGLGILLLSQSWLYGLRKLGVLLLLNGLGLLIVGLGLHFMVSSLIPTTSVESTELTVNAVEEASKIILADNANLFKISGIVALIAGIGSIVTSTVVLSKKTKSAVKKPETPTAAI